MTRSVWTLGTPELSNIATISMNVVLDSLVHEGLLSDDDASEFANTHCVYVHTKESFLSRILSTMGVRKKDPNDNEDSLRPIVMKIAMNVENYAKTFEKCADSDE